MYSEQTNKRELKVLRQRIERREEIIDAYKTIFKITIVIAVILMAISGFTTANLAVRKAEARFRDNFKVYETYTVKYGDTLWSIAKKNAGNTDIIKYIDDIKRSNNLYDDQIKSGDILLLYHFDPEVEQLMNN